MKKNDLVMVEIVDLGENGEGVGKLDQLTVFVPGGLPGETVKVQIVEVKRNYSVGSLVEIVKPSENRIKPPCPYGERCGGCSVQGLNYKTQLQYKEIKVAEAIKRIGKIEWETFHPILGMEEPWRYRNKGQYPVGGTAAAPKIGFYEMGSHKIVNMKTCLIHTEAQNQIINSIREWIIELGIEPYQEKTHSGTLRHILLRDGDEGKMMAVFVTNGPAFTQGEALAQKLVEAYPQIVSVYQNINGQRGNRILGFENRKMSGMERLPDKVSGAAFNLSPHSFRQVNTLQTEVLYGKAIEMAALKGTEQVIDLYCGMGTITLALAKHCHSVIGVESVSAAIEDAELSAGINGVKNVTFQCGNAEDILPKLAEEGVRADVIVLDPPRKGCEPAVLEAIGQMAPEQIVYVSCKASTLARDLGILAQKGYRLMDVQPVDLFPHSMHVEAVILMMRSGSDKKK